MKNNDNLDNDRIVWGQSLKAPFPWFGGKSRAARLIWSRLGRVRNYVEPFAGSLAVLLNRPNPIMGPESVNDKDGFIANVWRAIAVDPVAVAEYASWPVNECDLHARHAWLVERTETLTTTTPRLPDGGSGGFPVGLAVAGVQVMVLGTRLR